jgi:hypothetical protein
LRRESVNPGAARIDAPRKFKAFDARPDAYNA